MTAQASLVVDSRCTLAEGIVWCERRGAILWTDIQESRLWMHVPATGVTRRWSLPDRLGSFALCESGKLLLGLAKGLGMADIDASSGDSLAVMLLDEVEAGEPSRINDGRADRSGNFVFGTMDDGHVSPIGSFYQYSRHHGLRRLNLDRVTIANSIGFSPDGATMYFCDSTARRIMQCEYDAEAARVGNVRPFVEFGDARGFPDGSTVDADGGLWNATWGAFAVRRYAPDGSLDREVSVPVKNPSCAAFGGAAFDGLYVTTARQQMKPADLEAMPHAGGIYRIAPGNVRGLPETRFSD